MPDPRAPTAHLQPALPRLLAVTIAVLSLISPLVGFAVAALAHDLAVRRV